MSSGSEHVVHAAKAPATIYKDHILLPANAGDTRAHILEYPHMKEDLAWRDSKNLWDYVATTFDLIEERPKTLYNFFNPAVKSFKFSTDQMHEGTLATLMIWRVGDDVLCGVYNPPNDSRIRWVCVSKWKMSKIGSDADWSMCWDIWEGHQKDPTKDVHPSRTKKDDFISVPRYGNPFEAITSHFRLGFALLAYRVWAGVEYKCRVEVDKEPIP